MKTLVITAEAAKDLRKLKSVAPRIVAKLQDYAANPAAFPKVITLVGSTKRRIRIGEFRAIFTETETEVIVTAIAPRGSVYD